VGVVLGADQTYFQGFIARLVNPPYGIDVGFELGIVFAFITYLILRPIELRQRPIPSEQAEG